MTHLTLDKLFLTDKMDPLLTFTLLGHHLVMKAGRGIDPRCLIRALIYLSTAEN